MTNRILFAAVLSLVSATGADLELRQIDLHYHSGMERPVPLPEWIKHATADGRKAIALIDHLELYRKSPSEYAGWRSKGGFEALYPVGAEGHRALMASFDSVAKQHPELLIFKAWEVYEGELDTGPDIEALKLADFIGWHISPNHAGQPPDGALLIKRAKQIKELRKKLPVPMVLLHPFTMRIEHVQRKAREAGRPVSSLTVEDYRFFGPGEHEEFASALYSDSIYVEISRSTEAYWQDPVARRALIEDIAPLAEMGVRFTVSTDAHSLADATKPFRPEAYCKELGVNPGNASGLIQELSARQ